MFFPKFLVRVRDIVINYKGLLPNFGSYCFLTSFLKIFLSRIPVLYPRTLPLPCVYLQSNEHLVVEKVECPNLNWSKLVARSFK